MVKILFADDDTITQKLLLNILQKKGYEAVCCSNGQEVLDIYSTVKPDVVILDIEMPVLNGFETCIELRKRPDSFNVPIAMISAKDDEDDIVKGLTCGADEYILKPIRKSEVLSKISLLISKRALSFTNQIAENAIFANHYKINKIIAHGGYSTVYLAKDTRTEKLVAIKILESKNIEKNCVSQFLREAYGLSLLNQKNIVKLIEFGNYAGIYFLVTEFIEGPSLHELLKKGPITEHYASIIAKALCNAMKCMSTHGIIHRDIKPGNILLSKDGQIVLVDFGLAKDQHQRTLSFNGEMQGTPHFMAPEYINDEKNLDIKVDIYSLGITLFYAVSGRTPFSGSSISIIHSHLETEPPKLKDYAPLVSDSFSHMVDRMLVKNPVIRCSLQELINILKEYGKEGNNNMSDTQIIKTNQKKSLDEASLYYHKNPVPGKISIVATKRCDTQQDLSMAYSPGVAKPCMKINDDPQKVWDYTSKGNMVAVVSDGTAVLGLGNIGPEAGLPVMEGKAVLFKRFADIDAIPVCLSKVFDENGKTDPKALIETTERLEPTFGGINLEDIAAPACFEIEKSLKEKMSIPVFHDDQHGTAIISLAGITNALKIVDKKIENCKVVVNGAGASAIACSKFYLTGGAKRENLIMCDSKGVIFKGRESGMTPEKEYFASDTDARTLEEALVGADVFLGLSVGNVLTGDMINTMADNSIIFAMANPTPEVMPDIAKAAGAAIVGTGRTDFPNQVNNVLGFPGIFRGALDVRASDINEDMKLAATKALSELVTEKVPSHVYSVLAKAYPEDAKNGVFDGENPMKDTLVIPKPFDPRVVPRVAKYVAEAAMKSGVATIQIKDLAKYESELFDRIERANS